MLLASPCFNVLRPINSRLLKSLASRSLRPVSNIAAPVVVHRPDFDAIFSSRGLSLKDLQACPTPRDSSGTVTTTDDDGVLTPALRQSQFEKCINALIKRGAIDAALLAYRRELQAGITPSTSVTSHLLRASAKSISPQTQQDVTSTVLEAIENHKVSLDQGLLAAFLSNLIDARRYDALEEVVDTYQKAIVVSHKTKIGGAKTLWRPSGIICSIMIKGHCEAGRTQEALRWLQRYRHDWKDATKLGLNPQPYITLLHGLAMRFKPFTDPRPAYTVYRQMIEDGVPMHVMVFNILMALETRRNNLRRVFALYRVLERRHVATLKADATTYATLFAAHKAWLKTLPRQKRPRPAPRELFRTMLRRHHEHTHGRPSHPSLYLTGSTLNVVVSCFLRVQDYAAAIVALRTFAVCRLAPTTRIEWIVASTILRRINMDLAKNDDAEYGQWVERMRGRIMSARERKQEMDEMKGLLVSLKGLSHRAAAVLPPNELAAAHLALDSLIGTDGSGRRGVVLEGPALTNRQIRDEAQIKLSRPMKLVKRAIFATFPMGMSEEDTEERFGGIMASVNAQLLPPRSDRPRKHAVHPTDKLTRAGIKAGAIP